MLINPLLAIDSGWVVFPDVLLEPRESYIQPNAIDFTVDSLFELTHQIALCPTLGIAGKIMPNYVPAQEETRQLSLEDVECFVLSPHTTYDVHSNFYVTIPEGVCGELIIRSTLNRAGLRLQSGLYDSGYKGAIGCTLRNDSSMPIYVQKGMRVGQIKLLQSDSSGVYSGGYNREKGEVWHKGQ